MSAIGVILVIAVVILSVARRLNQMQGQGQGQRPRTPHTTQQPPYRQPPKTHQPPHQQSRPQPQPQPQPEQEQNAWDWMHSSSRPAPEARDPEGETLMYRDVPEDWIRPVEATVRVDLTEMRESQREIVHESVHESLHLRRDATADTTRPAPHKPGTIGLTHANLAQALILAEALGEPRSKRPWMPQRRR